MNIVSVLKDTFSAFREDQATRLAAALAYYTIFALAPLVVIAVFVAGLFFSSNRANEQLYNQIAAFLGQDAAQSLMNWAANTAIEPGGIAATVIGAVTLLIGATGVFNHLQQSLNTIWGVEPDQSGVGAIIKKRLLSFLMVLVIGLLLIAAILASAAISFASNFFSGILPGSDWLWTAGEFAVRVAITTLLFALIFKVLPDVDFSWRTVWVGALFTALLFNAGVLLISLYLGYASVGSTYGAAGSLVAILLFIYYSAMILFFGAEFTQVYARGKNTRIQPAKGAKFSDEQTRQAQRSDVVWRPLRAAQPIAGTGSTATKTRPEAPRGFFALVAFGVLTLTGGLLALFRLKPERGE